MNDQLDALIALQTADAGVQALETRLAALAPRLAKLEADRQGAEKALGSARAALEREGERHAHLSERAGEFRRMNERAVSQLDQVRKAQHATAAGAQVEISRRALADAETELHASGLRLAALQQALDGAESRIAALAAEQGPTREAIERERGEVERELGSARSGREALARHVEPRLLQKYDRVRSRRRGPAIFPLHHFTCGNCDTAIPTQRRAGMAAGAIEVCESCGVLLYATAAPATAGQPG